MWAAEKPHNLKGEIISKVLASVIVAVLLGGFTTAAPATAAGNTSCVTSWEFAKVKKGWSKSSVARAFGTKGKREVISRGYGMVMEIRSYDACTQFGVVSVSFDNGRLSAKSAVF